MGQRLSCVQQHEDHGLFPAVATGELEVVETMVEEDPTVLEHTTGHDRLSPLHVAAANGRIQVVLLELNAVVCFCCSVFLCVFDHSAVLVFEQVLSMLLDRSSNVDILNRQKQVFVSLVCVYL